MKIENIEVFNFKNSFRGMRNPKDSWERSDSDFSDPNNPIIGPNDMKLAQTLIAAGNEHRKFLRQIFVSMDITFPFYVWKEMDTYKVATVTNSCSSMHTLVNHPICISSFEIDDMEKSIAFPEAESIINYCEFLRKQYLATKDIKYWKELIRWLPESFLQKRTWSGNYETLRNIYHQRKNHKLTEWHKFCDTIMTLPYAEELIKYNN